VNILKNNAGSCEASVLLFAILRVEGCFHTCDNELWGCYSPSMALRDIVARFCSRSGSLVEIEEGFRDKGIG
jgi:hypothetical protein